MFWTILALIAVFALGTAAGIALDRTVGELVRRVRAAERSPRRLGPYTLTEKIGEGGMGEVHRASHAYLKRPTVVKLLRPERSSRQAIARFEREVQFTSQLAHPNTVAIFDYGRSREGAFYYAMEYLDGITLHSVVEDEGPMPEGRVLNVLRQICGSLDEAHQMGLVHRDIKASNVLLCDRAGIPDFVKVLDFGLVKMMEGDVNVTAEGSLTGTPLYMSPEAIRSPDKLDGRSDLYSVAVLGYYLLTGQYVFDGRTGMEICGHHLTSEPEPPSAKADVPVSPQLDAVLLRCLAKDREARYPSGRQLAKALAACPTAESWTEEDARAWWAKRAPEPRQHGEDR
jgi:serine/threonine protein kinase